MIQTKKLDISGRKAGVLTAALQSVSDGLPHEMRHVYGGIIRLIRDAGRDGRICLNSAQQSVVLNALDKLDDPDTEDIRCQLTMTRQEYRVMKDSQRHSDDDSRIPWLLARAHQDIEKGIVRTVAVYFDTDGIQGTDGAVDILDFNHMHIAMTTEKTIPENQLEHSAYRAGCSMAGLCSEHDVKIWPCDCRTVKELTDEILEQHSSDPFGWGCRMHPAMPDDNEERLLRSMLDQVEHAARYGLEN